MTKTDDKNGPQPPEDAPEETPEASPEEPPKPTEPVVVSTEDRHKAETAQLKLMLAVKDETIAQMNMATAAGRRQDAMMASNAVREELEKKYGINLMTHQIREVDGVVVPKGAADNLIQRLQGVA